MKKTDYLITGASGFLGRNIVAVLSPGKTISSLGRDARNSYRVDVAKEVPVFHENFSTIIHASGKVHSVPKTEKEARDFFDVNVQGTRNLMLGLSQSEQLPQRFIFISTVAVYGKESGADIAEDHPLLGQTPYAKSKIAAEALITEWCTAQGIILTILRLPLIVGPHPPGNLGAMITMMKRGWYVGIGSGLARKSMVLAQDVAAFIPIIEQVGGIYNLTDGSNPAMRALENALAAHLKKRIWRLPEGLLKTMAWVGDGLGKRSPLNSLVYKKLTATLTFSDTKARKVGWNPRAVIHHLPDVL
jgi:nucleoside-diphosphate-sugar epimerase